MRKVTANLFLTPFTFLIILSASCKKDGPGGTVHEPLPPFKTPKGESVGQAISKSIGAAGGNLSSPDAKLTVIVPAGTVSSNTNFSIQPITSTIPNAGSTIGYRLLPEGVHFTKPVTLVYRYDDTDLAGTKEDLLMGCYQTETGHWKSVPSVLNKAQQTISIGTDHFSDWSIISALTLKVHKPVITSHETTDIEVMGVDEGPDALLAPLVENELNGSISSIRNWKVLTGGGSLAPKATSSTIATYLPSTPITHGTKAEISVEIKGRITVKDTSVPGNQRRFEQVLLLAEVQLANETYMTGSFNGQPISAFDAEAHGVSGYISIVANAETDSSQISYMLQIAAANAGKYPCGNLLIPGNAEVAVSGAIGLNPVAYQSKYIACGPPSYDAYSNGSVTIDNWGGIGSYITGSFNGPVYQVPADRCSPPGRSLSIKFRAKRTL